MMILVILMILMIVVVVVMVGLDEDESGADVDGYIKYLSNISNLYPIHMETWLESFVRAL